MALLYATSANIESKLAELEPNSEKWTYIQQDLSKVKKQAAICVEQIDAHRQNMCVVADNMVKLLDKKSE